MTEFAKWRIAFDSSDAAMVERKHASDPPGYEPASTREVATSSSAPSKSQKDLLPAKQAALYNMAIGQCKNIGFLCFMMWMSGSQIHLFSIMMTVSGIYQPLMSIVNSKQAFPPEASEDGKLNILLPRLLYCLIQAGGLAYGLFKLNTMGLLPTHASDYVSALTVPTTQEYSSAGFVL